MSGLGIAAEAALLGFRVTLLERAQCGGATSANSLRIIHGGFRYLQRMDIPRVLESIHAKNELRASYPDLVEELRCVMPLARTGLKSAVPARIALALYGFLEWYAGFRNASSIRRVIAASQAQALFPALPTIAQHGMLEWTDGHLRFPDELVQRERRALLENGVNLLEWARASTVVREGHHYRVQFLQDGSEREAVASVVVNCLGPWLSAGLRKVGVPSGPFQRIRWCTGFNLLLSGRLSDTHALSFHSPRGRLYFLVPREHPQHGRISALGTGYLEHLGSPDSAAIDPSATEEFMEEFYRACPPFRSTGASVLGVEAGVLPMRSLGRTGPILYGREKIWSDRGYVEVLSTKYTTYRMQARRVLAQILRQRHPRR